MECDLMGTGFDASDKAAQRSVINPLFFLKSLIDWLIDWSKELRLSLELRFNASMHFLIRLRRRDSKPIAYLYI